MKTGIFIALAALALAVFAVADAQGEDAGRVQKLRLSGSTFITSSEGGMPTPMPGFQTFTSLSSGIVKGSDAAVWSSQAITGPAFPDARCTDPLLSFGGDISFTTVVTYADGSILSWESDTFYCSDGMVVVFEAESNVTGGEGRFEGATGTVKSAATGNLDGRVTTEARVDLD
jgi:hypothetical protein